jgi:hypothetical protein
MSDSKKAWKDYEEVAVYLLDQVGDRLGLDFERVEGKQHIYSSRSGAGWEIDGKAVTVGDEGFVIIECRRHTTSKIKQEQAAGLCSRTSAGSDAPPGRWRPSGSQAGPGSGPTRRRSEHATSSTHWSARTCGAPWSPNAAGRRNNGVTSPERPHEPTCCTPKPTNDL